MNRSNLTILERNTLDGFQLESTQELYLRGAQKDELKAFRMACEWEDKIYPLLFGSGLVSNAIDIQPKNEHTRDLNVVYDELLRFFMDRLFYMDFPKN